MVAGFPLSKLGISNVSRRIALEDLLTRKFGDYCEAKKYNLAANDTSANDVGGGGGWHSAKGGDFKIQRPGQEILQRSCLIISPTTGDIQVRFTVGLPAQGRTILGSLANTILTTHLHNLVENTLRFTAISHPDHQHHRLLSHLNLNQDQDFLRCQLSLNGLIAFIPNGAILPRISGTADLPMSTSSAVPFSSPDSLLVSFDLPNRGRIEGMGIRSGITLIVGGGFHGKSTLLDALKLG